MDNVRGQLGRWGEKLAAEYLTSLGYRVLLRNWRCPAGEIDLVAQVDDILALIEVRTRRSHRYGTPEDSITANKRVRLIACGEYLASELEWHGTWRIDIVAIDFESAGGPPRVRLIPNAIER